MKRALVAVVVLALVGAAAGVALWSHREDVDAVAIPGGSGASLPPATPQEQGLDPAAMALATRTAQDAGALALGIARRGHLVHLWTAEGDDALVTSPLLARLVLAAGDAARIPPPATPAADDAWAARLSIEVWKPLDAREARLRRRTNAPDVTCCLWLRARDALALAVELLDGRRHVVDGAAAAAALAALEDGIAPRGAEPFGARPARLWRDARGTRLYFFPPQDLVILVVRADEARLTDETLLAHQVLRGIVDLPAGIEPAPTPRDLVPAH